MTQVDSISNGSSIQELKSEPINIKSKKEKPMSIEYKENIETPSKSILPESAIVPTEIQSNIVEEFSIFKIGDNDESEYITQKVILNRKN